MSLSPFAIPFFSCSTSSFNSCNRNFYLHKASSLLSPFDFKLFSKILSEWESCFFLDHCFTKWKEYSTTKDTNVFSSLYTLSFNVRGLGLRWQEILLLISSLNPDILVLLETGNLDLSFFEKIFHNFKLSFKKEKIKMEVF